MKLKSTSVNTKHISPERLQAFSDGVMAIAITIIVLEIKVPHEATLEALKPLLPVFVAYALSFRQVGTYWNNHHHLFRLAKQITPQIMWANLNLLFFISLTPFVTLWLGENFTAAWPAALFGINALACGAAYQGLQRAIIRDHSKEALEAAGLTNDRKGTLSVIAYTAAIPLAFVSTWLSVALYIAVAILWFIPDNRVESVLNHE